MRKFTMSWSHSEGRITASLKVIEDKGYRYVETAGLRSFDNLDEATSWAYNVASTLGFDKIEIDFDFLI